MKRMFFIYLVKPLALLFLTLLRRISNLRALKNEFIFSNALIQLGWVENKLSCFFTKLICFTLLTVLVLSGWTGCKNNNDDQLPSGSMVNHSECKASTNATLSNSASFSVPKEMECLEYNYDGESSLIIKHLNTAFNCCPDNFVTSIFINNNIITIKEDDAKHGCDCDCLYDLEYKIENLPAGIYTIRIDNTHISGIQPLECTVDLRTALTNTCCITRDRYPWI